MSEPVDEPQAIAIMLYAVENHLPTQTDIQEQKWQDIDEAIIGAVRSLPNLYDPSRQDYRDCVKRRHSFASIGRKLKMKGYDVIKRWKALRDNYAREKRSLQAKIRNGAPAGTSSEWKHFASLSFLQDHVKSRKNNLMEEMDLTYDSELEGSTDTATTLQFGDVAEECDTTQTSFNLADILDVTYEFVPDTQSGDGVEECDTTQSLLAVDQPIIEDNLLSAASDNVAENDAVTQSLLCDEPTFQDDLDTASGSRTFSLPSSFYKDDDCQPKERCKTMEDSIITGLMEVNRAMRQSESTAAINEKTGRNVQLACEPNFDDNVNDASGYTSSQPSFYNMGDGCRPKGWCKIMQNNIITGLMEVSKAIQQSARPQETIDEATAHGMNIAQRLMRLSHHQSSRAQIQILQVLHEIEFDTVT